MSFIIANWKSNGSRQQAREWAGEVAQQLPALLESQPGRSLCMAAPYVLLPEFAAQLAQYKQDNPQAADAFSLAAQNLSAHPAGAYTGELHGELLREFCEYVLIGHSERRALFGEDEAVLAAKLQQALAAGLTPIFCLGENEQEREAGETEAVLQQQLQPVLAALAAHKDSNNATASSTDDNSNTNNAEHNTENNSSSTGSANGFDKGANQETGAATSSAPRLIIAYEPVWAIGTGKAATPDIAAAAHGFIKQQLAQISADYANTIPVVYGGSVKPDNAAEFLAQQKVDGLLVGGASLQASSMLQIFSA